MKRRGCPILGLLCFVSWQWPQGHQLHLQFADFTAIPICHSPTASLNRLARTELEDAGLSVQATPGRWYLRGEGHGTEALAALAAMAEVRHVRSIRRIVLCYDTASASVTGAEATNKQLAQMLDAAADWDLALQDLKYLSAKPVSSCCVVCKRPKQTALLGFDASELRQELAKCLERRLGWSATGRGRSPDISVHLHVTEQSIWIEVPILQQDHMVIGGALPFQGMHHVEAWAIARTLDVQAGETVLDPMCGQGTLLAEAAIWWPKARYVGCDVNSSQLLRCRGNFAALSKDVRLHQVDTVDDGIPLNRVEKIMVAPPWNRQFAIHGSPQDFYQQMLLELFRVVHPEGRIVLFVSQRVLQRIRAALVACDSTWEIVVQRSFTVTRKTVGIIVVLEAEGSGSVSKRLFWEGDAPADGRELYEHWRELRAHGFPRLHPIGT